MIRKPQIHKTHEIGKKKKKNMGFGDPLYKKIN
jgi:hypothetical protein